MSDQNDNSLTARLRAAPRHARCAGSHAGAAEIRAFATGHRQARTDRAVASASDGIGRGGRQLVRVAPLTRTCRRECRGPASVGGTPVSAGTTSVAAASSTKVSSANSPVVQRAALPGAESAAGTERLTSRAQSPGVLAVGSTMSRPAATSSFSDAPAFAARLQSRYGLTSSESAAATAPVPAAPAPSISRAPAGVIRRRVDAANSTASPSSHDTASVASASRPVLPGIGAAPMLARKASAAGAMGSTLPLAGNGSPSAPASRPADSPQITGIPMMPAARPLLSAGSAAGAPLVLAAHAGGAGAIELAAVTGHAAGNGPTAT